MWDGFNQRKFPRLKLDCQITLHPFEQKNPIPVQTENIGIGGVCVIQHQALVRFSLCKVRLELDKKNPPVECNGKVVWIIPTREPSLRDECFDTGIEFVDLNSAQREQIQSFIQTHVPKGFQDIA